jgi:2-oxoglutarate dehydrogenase E1 component
LSPIEKNKYDNNIIDWELQRHLLTEFIWPRKFDIRISGQDHEEGHFAPSCVISCKSRDSEEKVILLDKIKKGSFKFTILSFWIWCSGFDYGTRVDNLIHLTILGSTIQISVTESNHLIDQYISCGEDKWNNQNGIVLLYPPRLWRSRCRAFPLQNGTLLHNLHTVTCMLPIVQRQRISFIGDKWKPPSVNHL